MSTSSDVRWLPPVAEPVGEPPPPRRRDLARLRRLLGALALVALFLLKFGAKLKGLLLLLPKLKLFSTGASALVSIAAYALIWGWRFAVGFVVLLFVHEMGHVWQLRREGIKASAPLFIPFLGAAIAAKSMGRDAAAEARVGLAGPIFGTAAAAALIPVAEATDSDLLRALAYVGFFLNLFNLIPVVPFDGGRAMAAMAPWMWFVGLAAMAGMAIAFVNPFILLFALLGAAVTWQRWKERRAGGPTVLAYYGLRPQQRFAVATVYLALIAACVVGMDVMYVERTLDDV